MLSFDFRSVRRVLCLGCHADDIEIGCGGTLLKILSQSESAEVIWAVLSADSTRRQEAQASADRFLQQAGQSEVIFEEYRDAYFPFQGIEIKDWMQALAARFQPDLILTHRREDLHQDHRLVAELTWNAFRNHWILEYEIPKYEGDLGNPNVLVPLEQETAQRKIQIISESFVSQHTKQWFSEETFWALMRLRGLEAHSPTGLAEGFHCRKLCF